MLTNLGKGGNVSECLLTFEGKEEIGNGKVSHMLGAGGSNKTLQTSNISTYLEEGG